MGTWGTGIYSNDTAADVKELCQEIFPFVNVDDGNRIIFEQYAEVLNSTTIDNDYTSFWYALADWQWKHGILTEDIRYKAISLLESHAGISDWEESGQTKDVKKRIATMDALKEQLERDMPPKKLPAKRLKKPQHKIGDIIVFRTCDIDEEQRQNCWRIEKMVPPYFYKDPTLTQGPCNLEPPFLAHGKYMAVLCVGTMKEQYSPYVPKLYNEYSVYAYYDYISCEAPTLETLKKHGFLASCVEKWKKIDSSMSVLEMNDLPLIYLGWTYTFYLEDNIRISKYECLDNVIRFNCFEEVDRFRLLINGKDYSDINEWHSALQTAFSSFWSEKLRLERLGAQLDNLLNPDIVNPELESPETANKIRKNIVLESD